MSNVVPIHEKQFKDILLLCNGNRVAFSIEVNFLCQQNIRFIFYKHDLRKSRVFSVKDIQSMDSSSLLETIESDINYLNEADKMLNK